MSTYQRSFDQYGDGPAELWGEDIWTEDGAFIRVYTIPKSVIIRLEKHGYVAYSEEPRMSGEEPYRRWSLTTQGTLYLHAKRERMIALRKQRAQLGAGRGEG